MNPKFCRSSVPDRRTTPNLVSLNPRQTGLGYVLLYHATPQVYREYSGIVLVTVQTPKKDLNPNFFPKPTSKIKIENTACPKAQTVTEAKTEKKRKRREEVPVDDFRVVLRV